MVTASDEWPAASRTDFYTMDTMQVPQGTGSGFIWDMKGHVVTNFHVIRGASDIKVALIDSSVYPAKVRQLLKKLPPAMYIYHDLPAMLAVDLTLNATTAAPPIVCTILQPMRAINIVATKLAMQLLGQRGQ